MLIRVWAGLALLVAAGAVLAVPVPMTVTFDDIDAAAGDVPITFPYARLNWSNFLAYTSLAGFEGFNHGIVSPQNAAYSGGRTGGPIQPIIGSISAATGTFDLLGGYFGAGYYDQLLLTLTGFRDGAPVFSRTITLKTTGAQPFSFDFTNIDSLTFATVRGAAGNDPFSCGRFNCTQFTVDDLSLVLQYGTVTPVSEPNSLALMVAALSGVGLSRLRKRRSPAAI